ncbi:polymorphic toxin type 15 domain-containing protein [Chryseobacterium sp. CFBP8996]|uniref:polymorphic toxin type 15 domain-containing protein n=1 Tax=Chryseobacterium sp. CFBP8996 TaxID=3096529 RepID=UPI002A699EED|nr:polymorphic toxin type 15 domain-containing protein [Chryseobacterium sp. CFBP8996]MDY0933121.1 polymorphic toxin type 15 domain-containing protein [Chryseobacterium sp. CFBP8996]
MKTAKPVEKDNKVHQSQAKNNKQKEPTVVPLSEVETVGAQTQTSEGTKTKPGSGGLNGNIVPVHGSQTIYDQGSEIMYKRYQESLAQTGDIDHPETKKIEKGYMITLSIDQLRDHNDIRSGTYLPKTVEEQAAMTQSGKGNSETSVSEMTEPVAPVEVQAVQDSVALPDMSAEFVLPGEQEVAERTTPTSSNSDPRFNQVVGSVKNTAKAKRVHNTKEKAEIHTKAAAAVPNGERKSKARGQQVQQLDHLKSGSFTAIGFKAKLKERIKSVNLPEKQGDADNFEKRNNINTVNGDIKKDVITSKNNVTGSIQSVAREEPNEAKIAQRKSTALPDPKIGSKVNIKATDAMPPKRGDSELSEPIAKSYKAVEQQFVKNNITDEQLANSNEPDFIDALNAKNAAKENAENAPKEFKNAENKKLEASKQAAQGKTNSTMEGMHNSRKGLLDGVTNKQHKAGKEDTAKHKEAVEKLNTIYEKTKRSVGEQLNDLEIKVTQLFDDGAKKAKSAFEKEVTQKLEDYKAKRYGKWYSVDKYGERWEDFKNGKLPDEVDKFYKKGKENFITAMDVVIGQIAKLVAERLNNAKASITSGREKVASVIKNLPADVKKAIKGDIDAIQGQFKELESSISDKESSLIDTLTTKYNNTLKEVDELIVDIKKRNLGFLSTLGEKTVGVWKTIQEIKKTLTELISGAVSAIMAIVADPIGFLSKLIDGVSQGFINFGTNIWTHLKTGFFGWLTGAMKNISFTMPEDVFSLKGIFSISTQMLGLTWTNIRSIGASVVGERAMKVLEGGFDMVMIVQRDGFAGLWEHVKDQFADIKNTVMDTIIDIIKTQAVQAGIKWVMGLLTPAGAFIKAAMAIIDIVKFFIQKASQIMELIKAFTDGVKAIASGNVGAVAKAIENALGKAIPVVIGFLASLAGLGGITDKVVAVVRKISKRIENAIVKFWNFVKVKAKGLLGKFMGKSKKDNTHEPEKQKKIDAGFIYLKEEEKKVDDNHNNKLTIEQAAIAAKRTKAKYPVFSSLKAESQDDKIIYRYTASPENIHETGTKLESNEKDEEKIETGSKEKIRMLRKIITFDKIKFSSKAIENGSPVYDEKHSDEYLKQLKVQERGINKMRAVDWLRNKSIFDEFKRQKDNNATVRTRIKRDLEINFQKKYKVKLLEKNYSDEKIIRMSGKYANNLMKNTAVLHNPDQVAGGKANIDYEKGSIKDRTDLQNSEIIGTSQVNWYIGTQQWPRKEDHEKRATILKEHAQLQYDKTPEADKGKLMMSVTLKVV